MEGLIRGVGVGGGGGRVEGFIVQFLLLKIHGCFSVLRKTLLSS